jgi:hypothetical protein
MQVPDNLVIQNSPVHGLGVFAIAALGVGDVLGEFTGTKMLKSEFIKIYGKDNRYVYWATQNFPNTTVIVSKDPRNFITYINESVTPNVKLIKTKLIAITDIEIGEELFLYYGKKSAYPRDYFL